MGGLFDKQAQSQLEPAQYGSQYDDLVTRALVRLTRWAFPDSQVEHKDATTWQLWHTTADGKKYIDVVVELQLKKGKPCGFMCSDSMSIQMAEKLTRESLDDALRLSICSIHD